MRAANPSQAGFTLVEILVAMALMAAVVPVVIQALRVASLAGEVSQRKVLATRVAEKVLDEAVLTSQWNRAQQNGSEQVGNLQFKWTLHNDPWQEIVGNAVNPNLINGVNATVVSPNSLHQITVDVDYPAQNQNFSVHLSTLVDVTQVPSSLQQITIPQR